MIEEKKYNYVYIIDYPNGMKYIGVRSCNCEVKDDEYLGSSKYIPDDIKKSGIKTILKMFNTRQEAMEYEIKLHKEIDVKNHPEYYNQCNSSSTKFQIGKEAAIKAALTRTGRTKETHDYILRQVKTREKYKGENRTEAQKATDKHITEAQIYADKFKRTRSGNNQTDAQKAGRITMRAKLTGVKNPAKGHPGASSTSFVPWYYIDDKGIRTEIHNISKKDFAKSLGIGYRVFIYRFSKDNEHKPMLTGKNGKLYMWTFGNLSTPNQTISRRKN